MPSNQVTRNKALFDKRGLYVRPCHIVEHEDNETMRAQEWAWPSEAVDVFEQ
ncbi:hypothetical protein ACH4TX_03285 [Streptomyces sp. NPDC021098]|uniref:hypothetical protein n=1 Tax=unclassified Streptomyces TaxID=2593676 RepID=UPI0037A34D07